MDYKAIAVAIKLCGSTPKVDQCKKECPYWNDGDMSKCIPRMTEDAATAIIDLLARAEAAEAQRDEAVHDRMMMEQRIGELNARAEKAESERDAAVDRIRQDHWCEDCKYRPTYSICKNDGNCEECESPCFCEGCKDGSLWEWRGQKEV